MGWCCGWGGAWEDCERDPQDARFVSFNTFILVTISTNFEAVERDLKSLRKRLPPLAIFFVHSDTYPAHERAIGNLARSLGFTYISESAQFLPMMKMVPRGVSSTADAYLP
jgi:5-oxoprolinase (ATP-hydrolysing)